ncbi:MAG TPA: MaoC family dehydratase [Xanthobacteraceae bacterium]|nr:MaoC family dehydratase [Xanthobacteraceae bacterium]
MRMLTVETAADLAKHVGETLGTSEWFAIDQKMIDAFAEATGDHSWIHVDVERAKREMPGGKTIAHGYLTLSLIPRLSQTVYRIQQRGKGFNYGANRIRFTAPVPVGSRVRLTETLKDAQETGSGLRLTFDCVMEVEGGQRPAMLAEIIVLIAKD